MLGGALGSTFAVGLTIYVFGVFQDALVVAFDTDVATLSFAPSLFTAIGALLSPLAGRALATGRVSIRVVMACGAVAIGLGLLLVSRADTLAMASLAFVALMVPGTILMGPLVGQTLITNWFDAARGRALGLVSAGTTLGGVLMPPLAAALIGGFGWRDAMSALGVLAIAVGGPIVWLCVRDAPAAVGELPDGATASAPYPSTYSDASSGLVVDDERAVAKRPARPTAELLRDPGLLLSGVAFGAISGAGLISTIFTVPFATELGIPLVAGSLIAALRAGSAMLGKVACGTLSDRFGARRVLLGVLAVEILLTLALISTREPLLFAALGVGIGFVGGAPLPLRGALVGRLFGRHEFAAAMGLLSPIGLPFSLAAAPLAGWIYARADSYAAAFALAIPLFVAGAACLALVREPAPASPPRMEEAPGSDA